MSPSYEQAYIFFLSPVIAGASAAVAATFDLKFCHTFCSSWFSACLCVWMCVCAFHRFRHIFILCSCVLIFFCTLIDVWLLLPFLMDIYVEVWFESKNPHNKSAKTDFNIFHWQSEHFMMIDRASDFIQMVTEIHINLFDTLTIYLPVVSSPKKNMCFSVFMQQTVKRWLLPSFSGYMIFKIVLTAIICFNADDSQSKNLELMRNNTAR